MGRRPLLLAAILAFAALLRAYPYLSTGVQFSIDSWPLLRDAEVLERLTPVPVDAGAFDGYNNYWPGVMVYLVCVKLLTRAGYDAVAGLAPAAHGLAFILAVCAIVRRLEGSSAALLAAALLAAIYPHAFFSSGLTKESLALPIYGSLLAASLAGGSGSPAAIAVLAAALALYHHLTTLIAALALLYLTVWSAMEWRMGGAFRPSIPTGMAAAFLAGLVHYLSLGRRGLGVELLRQDLAVNLSGYIVFFAMVSAVMHARKGGSRGVRLSIRLVAAVASLAAAYVALTRGVYEGWPALGERYLPLAAPYVVLAAFSYDNRRAGEGSEVAGYWLSAVVSLMAYVVFLNVPSLPVPVYRLFNVATVPLAVLSAVVLAREPRPARLAAALFVAAFGIHAYLMAYSGDPYLGYQWRYSRGEVAAATWLSAHGCAYGVSGDLKVEALYRGYLGLNCSTGPARNLVLGGVAVGRFVVVVHRDMLAVGFLAAAYPTPIDPGALMARLAGHDKIYHGSGVVDYLVLG